MPHQVKLAAVGLGRLGWYHAETLAFRIPNAQLTAVCSISQDELQRAKYTFPSISTHHYFAELLTTDIDGVVLSTPSNLHCQQIEQALEQGLHVFCEKPLGTNLAECERMKAIVEKYPKQVFMLGFMRRYDPSYQYAYQLVQDGAIGRPILFRGYSVDPIQNIQGALKYAPHSAGQFLDMAIHDIDLSRWFLDSEPTSIYAIGGCYAYKEFAQYQDGDNVSALMQFANQSMAFLFAGRTAPHGYNIETEIVGTKSTLRIGSVPQKNFVEILDQQGVRKLCSEDFIERFAEAYSREINEFVNCIIDNRQPQITIEDGIEATRIALAATESFQKQQLVML